MRIAVIPNCNYFEDHFTRVGVTPAQLAGGSYRGTWIVHYARVLADLGWRVSVIVPSRHGSWTERGALLDVVGVRSRIPHRFVPRSASRWRVRPLLSWLSSVGLEHELDGFDAIYVQEYASGRFAYLSRRVESTARLLAAHHGTSIQAVPRWITAAVAGSGWTLTCLTTLEKKALVARCRVNAVLLRNPVSPEFESTRAWAPPREPTEEGSETQSLVWVGRLEDRAKNLRLLLNIAEALQRNSSKINVRVFGTGPDEKRLRGDVARRGLDQYLVVVGPLYDARALAEEMVRSVGLLNTSRVEGFPVSVAEALALGVPCFLARLPYVSSELECTSGVYPFDGEDAVEIADMIEAHVSRMAAPETSVCRSKLFSSQQFGRSLQQLLESQRD